MIPGPACATPDTTALSVAVVLVNWNNWQDCTNCIDSLLGMDYPAFHIYVVDNASSDGSVEQISRWCSTPTQQDTNPAHGIRRWTDQLLPTPITCRVVVNNDTDLPEPAPDCRLTLIQVGGNLGFAGGCNVGIRSASPARCSWFWFLNTDTVVDQHALSALVTRAAQHDQPGMVGSSVLYYERPDTVQALAGAWLNTTSGESRHLGEGIPRRNIPTDPTQVEQQLTYIFGASMLVSSKLIKKIGLMQEDYFLYYEEMDWAMRSRNQFGFGYAPGSLVFHKSGTSSSRIKPLFTANLFYRNRIRFISRFMPQCLPATRRQLWTALLRALAKLRWNEAQLLFDILRNAKQIADDAVRHQPQSPLP